MIVTLMRGVFFEAAINGATLVANRHGGNEVIEDEVNGRGDKQADEFGMITKNHADGKNQQAQTRVEILLQIKRVVTTNAAALDNLGFLGGEVRKRYVTSVANQARGGIPIRFLFDVAMRANKFDSHAAAMFS